MFQEVRERFPQLELRRDVSFRDLTTLGVGSRLPLLAEVVDEAQLSELLKFAASRTIRVLILGNGSNLVGSDEPPEVLAIRLSARGFCAVTVDAEEPLRSLARRVIERTGAISGIRFSPEGRYLLRARMEQNLLRFSLTDSTTGATVWRESVPVAAGTR